MSNQHASNPIPFRPLPGQREALKRLATKPATVNALLREAVTDLLAKYDGKPPAGPKAITAERAAPCLHPSAGMDGDYCTTCKQEVI